MYILRYKKLMCMESNSLFFCDAETDGNWLYFVSAYYTSIETIIYKNLGDLLTYDPLLEIK